MKLSTSAFCIVFTAVIAFLAVPSATDALAQTSTCVFDPASQHVKFTITGDPVEYNIHPSFEGCSEVDTNTITLMGPAISDSIPVSCLIGEGYGCGLVEVAVCEGENCFDFYTFNLKCGADCIITETDDCLPTISEWGMLVLLTLLVITGAYLVRRKRATANR
ncbi:MAG: IPTL-CTERM sorting domain-containing protein [candidate division Zixibacteria bacterium]|jgi:hypothetical protein|nr:IPTL-CTERM sorting domain-containing protein [candidate division Zixibacteria bacterium]